MALMVLRGADSFDGRISQAPCRCNVVIMVMMNVLRCHVDATCQWLDRSKTKEL
jgi:hypothetical protein